jgi:hypothetical protein
MNKYQDSITGGKSREQRRMNMAKGLSVPVGIQNIEACRSHFKKGTREKGRIWRG